MAKLKNDFISIEVDKLGAELQSLKKTGNDFEFIWKGDANFWSGRSPVLFPIVGSVINDLTEIEGEYYPLKNHGFARRNEFLLNKQTENTLVFTLQSNQDTLKIYPYQFELRLIYSLHENNVKINYEIENTDTKEIYFQLGTHPGFNLELNSILSDYVLEFSKLETLKRYFLNNSNLIIPAKEEIILQNSTRLALSKEQFYEGALIFRDVKSQSVNLKNKQTDFSVRMSWENFPYLGIWQPRDAPFICIEPWHGLGDTEGNVVAFKDKEQIVSLQVGGVFKASISIQI